MSLQERMKKYAELDVRRAILHELAGFRLTNQVELEDENTGLSLVDALSCGDDVSTGYEELERLADNIADVFDDKLQATVRALEVAREALISCELEFDRLRIQSGMYYAEKGLKIARPALQHINQTLGKAGA